MTGHTEHWWVQVRFEDGTPGILQIAEVEFDGDAPQRAGLMATCASLGPNDMADLTLIEPVPAPRRALTIEAIWEAFAASDRHGSGYVAGLQAEVEEDEECQPTGKRYTLIDGYFDLERVAEILNGKETQA